MSYSTYLKVHQLTDTFHTSDPFEIAEELGFKIYYKDIGSKKGMCTSMLGFTDIILNESIKNTPEALSVMAHELCHGVEHTSCAAWYTVGKMQQNQMEYQANNFAWYDLQALYKEECGERPNDFNDLKVAYGMPDEYYEFFSSADTK